MRSRAIFVAVAAGIILCGAVAMWKFVYVPRHRPNVILIVIDTLRADHLPVYGYPRMTAPFLTALSKRAAVFNGVSPTSWTKPAVASIITGLHPLRHQTYGRTDALPQDVKTLAETLHESGYYTAGFTANNWTSRAFGFERGFDDYTFIEGSAAAVNADAATVNAEVFRGLNRVRCPCFLFVHYVDPHLPYHPATAWDGSALTPADAKGLNPEELRINEYVDRPAALMNRAVDLYDGEIRQVDAGIKELLSGFDRAGIMKNSIVVVTADHGEEFAEHGRMGHGQSLYEEMTRVPMLIAGSSVAAGVREGRASLLDIVPTILDVLGMDHSFADGVSLKSNLTKPAAVANREFLSHLDFQDSPSSAKGLRVTYAGLAYTDRSQKMILSKSRVSKELFDLQKDRSEHDNRFGRDSAISESLAKRMSETYNGLSKRRFQRASVSLQNETARTLRALGYLVHGGDVDEQRAVPSRITPADQDPQGDLGWSNAHPCIDLGGSADESQLLSGWYVAETGGRWMSREARVVLPLTEKVRKVSITGYNGQPNVIDLQVSVQNTPIAEKHIEKGGFSMDAALTKPRQSNVVKLSVSSTFRPSEHGGADSRELGVLVTKMCAQE